jgi:hypothetical protein
MYFLCSPSRGIISRTIFQLSLTTDFTYVIFGKLNVSRNTDDNLIEYSGFCFVFL